MRCDDFIPATDLRLYVRHDLCDNKFTYKFASDCEIAEYKTGIDMDRFFFKRPTSIKVPIASGEDCKIVAGILALNRCAVQCEHNPLGSYLIIDNDTKFCPRMIIR